MSGRGSGAAASRGRAVLAALVVSLGVVVATSASPSSAYGAASHPCIPKQLSVTARTWIYNPSTFGTVFEMLPITITNHGATCVLAGTPKIAPTLTGTRRVIGGATTATVIDGATVINKPSSRLTLRPGHSAFTYLYLAYPVGHTAAARRWKQICQPVVATGLTIYIVPSRSLWNRHVATAVPEVCTTGRANDLRSGPLGSSPAH